jgi:hippurate hydrolase
LFERFPCDSVYALHTAPGLPVGIIATAAGPLMSAAGLFGVTFSGAGGHGGQGAHLTADLTVAQASYVLALQSVVARDVPALETAVVSVGYISGGSAQSPNVMPATLLLGGTTRCFSRETQMLVGRRLEELAQSLAAAYRCTASVELTWVTPPLVNPPEQAGIVVRAATAALGDSNVRGDMPPVTGGEDFAFMMERKPGALVFLCNDAAAVAP